MTAVLIAAAIVTCMASGLPALASRRAAVASTVLMLAGAATGLSASLFALISGTTPVLELPWHVPVGALLLRVDALSAFFAAPVFLLAGTGALYAERYWPAENERSGYVRAFFGVMTGSLALVMCAGSTILFLAAWEIVAVSSFFLIATRHEDEESRSAAWIYLAASHVATLALFAIVALIHSLNQGWSFALPLNIGSMPEGRAIFTLALIAFGVKAGIMPLHIWLPGAHAAAPTHVSSVMSGVAIKMGIYGLVRVLSLYDAIPQSFGTILLVAGIVSSILGVAFALAQHDIKRLLAYHSIENIGIIVTGLGIGVVAQAHHLPLLAFLGYAGALLHVWNHGLFKALLFLSAGAAIHGVQTREIDRMGGLAHRMPGTATAFFIGAAAISGLPPLNGFVSEWLLYVSGFRSIIAAPQNSALLLILVVPALALTGTLALACFVKAFGAVFLGAPRSEEAMKAHEAPAAMRIAMAPLVAGCVLIGLLPAMFAPIITSAVQVAAPRVATSTRLTTVLQPLQSAALVIAAIVVLAVMLIRIRTRRTAAAVTWDCGYAAPTARMQYTASSTARALVGFFSWAMPPVVHAPRPFQLFPERARFESHVPDTVLDRALLPALRGGRWVLGFARYIQHGRMQLYLVYLGATLVLLLAWSAK